MKKSNEDQIELAVNAKQGQFLIDTTSHHFSMVGLVGCRGSGKSVTLADLLMIAAKSLARGMCGLGVPTIKNAKGTLIAGLKAAWLRWGCQEYDTKTGEGDYVLWRKPPVGFLLPYEQPANWKNCITFSNGFCIEFEGKAVSKQNTNFDLYVISEGQSCQRKRLNRIIPAIRANIGKFDSFLHHSLFVFSSPPWTPDGQWVYEIEELAKKEPDSYYFMEMKTQDNQVFLPANYIEQQRKLLPKMLFDVDVAGKRVSDSATSNGVDETSCAIDLALIEKPTQIVFNAKTMTVEPAAAEPTPIPDTSHEEI